MGSQKILCIMLFVIRKVTLSNKFKNSLKTKNIFNHQKWTYLLIISYSIIEDMYFVIINNQKERIIEKRYLQKNSQLKPLLNLENP